LISGVIITEALLLLSTEYMIRTSWMTQVTQGHKGTVLLCSS